MTAICVSPISWEILADYWANDADEAETERIDEHLMGCEFCSAASARVAVIAEAIRGEIPPFVVRADVDALRARGLSVVENPVKTGARVTAVFKADADILLHRLGGLELTHVENVAATITVEEGGPFRLEQPRVPFDRSSGEILVACQRHFEELGLNVVFDVRMTEASGTERHARYVIPHVFEARK